MSILEQYVPDMLQSKMAKISFQEESVQVAYYARIESLNQIEGTTFVSVVAEGEVLARP